MRRQPSVSTPNRPAPDRASYALTKLGQCQSLEKIKEATAYDNPRQPGNTAVNSRWHKATTWQRSTHSPTVTIHPTVMALQEREECSGV